MGAEKVRMKAFNFVESAITSDLDLPGWRRSICFAFAGLIGIADAAFGMFFLSRFSFPGYDC